MDGTITSLPVIVELRVGESVRLPQYGYTVTFEKVAEDSRCPMDAICDWQGDAAEYVATLVLSGGSSIR